MIEILEGDPFTVVMGRGQRSGYELKLFLPDVAVDGTLKQ